MLRPITGLPEADLPPALPSEAPFPRDKTRPVARLRRQEAMTRTMRAFMLRHGLASGGRDGKQKGCPKTGLTCLSFVTLFPHV